MEKRVFDKYGYDENGYNAEGYDKFGYDVEGYDKEGYDKRGYNQEGYNKITGTELNREGYNKEGYNIEGYDKEGYDKFGYNAEGYNREGYNQEGYDKEGYDRKGFNKEKFDREGYNKEGYNKEGYNREGRNKYGFDRNGYDVDYFDIYGYNLDGYALDGYDKEGYSRAGYNLYGFHKDDFDELGFHMYSGRNKEGYDREGYDINGFNAEGYNKEGYDWEGYNKEGFNDEGYNKEGYNREGYNKEGFNVRGYNREGYDKNGYNLEGYDKNGYNKFGYNREGYSIYGIDIGGNVKTEISNDSQIQYGLKIRKIKTNDRGVVDGVSGGYVYFSMYKDIGGKCTQTKAKLANFKELFLIDVSGNADDYRLEAMYNTKTLKYLYEEYINRICIKKHKPIIRSYIDDAGRIVEKVIESPVPTGDPLEIAKNIANEIYFTHIDYKDDPNLYIGKREIPGYVVDWADKRASYYYNYNIYTADSKLGIKYVRDIIIKDGVFFDFKDKYNIQCGDNKTLKGVSDTKLLEILDRNRSSKEIHDIIESIQLQQYEIITQNKDLNSLVLGCAGSGKTMILLHRIRHILYNNKDIPEEAMIVVSPNDILGRESKELANILNIEKVKQWTTAKLYLMVVNDILKRKNLFSRTNEIQIIESKMCINDGVVSQCLDIMKGTGFSLYKNKYIKERRFELEAERAEIEESLGKEQFEKLNGLYLSCVNKLREYSYEVIERAVNYYQNIDENIRIKKNRLLAFEYILSNLRKGHTQRDDYDAQEKQEKRFEILLSHIDKVDFNKIKQMCESETNPIVRFVQAISVATKENNGEIIKVMIDRIKNSTYGEIENFVNQLKKNIDKDIAKRNTKIGLSLILDGKCFCIGDSSNEGKTIDEVFTNLQDIGLFINMVNDQCSDKKENPFILFRVYNDIDQEIKMLENADNSSDFIFDMMISKLGIKRDRKNMKIYANKEQLKCMFHILMNQYKIVCNYKYYIFIDEFQDYSYDELADINKYFETSVVSLYGDVNQCINNNGISNIENISSIMSFKSRYELKENYRNAAEITEYVNNRFNMHMYKIGLPGKVSEFSTINLSPLENKDRGAIIVANEEYAYNVDLDGWSGIVKYYNQERCVCKDCYNVLTVEQAKGLEFEKVVVIENGMNKNQLYVACTRAIRELEVVSL